MTKQQLQQWIYSDVKQLVQDNIIDDVEAGLLLGYYGVV
mgnify:CR=1 FL=1